MQSDPLLTIIDPEPVPPKPAPKHKPGAGWYQAVLVYYPYKDNLDKGKSEAVETLILATSLLSAQQQASKWANSIRAKYPISAVYPIEGKWEEVRREDMKYGKIWKKPGKYFSCNPEIRLVPNQMF